MLGELQANRSEQLNKGYMLCWDIRSELSFSSLSDWSARILVSQVIFIILLLK